MKNKIILILMIFLFTGCYNYRELNSIAIMSAVGIDKVGDKYRVTIQIINTQKMGDNTTDEQTKFITYKTESETLQDAFRKVVLESPKRLYGNHLQLLVIGEDYAKEGIGQIFDFFMRYLESRKQFTTLIAKDSKAEDVLEILTPLETTNAKNIVSSIEADSKYYGSTQEILFEELVQNYLNKNKDMILGSVEVKGNEKEGETLENLKDTSPSAELQLSGMAIFKGEKLVGYLDQEESMINGILNNENKVMIINTKCDNDKYMAIQTIKSSSDISPIKDSLNIKIDVNLEGNISEVQCDLDLDDSKIISEIEKKYEQNIKEKIESTLEKVNKDYNADTFGILDLIYKSNTKYYYNIKENWYQEHLKNLNFDVKVSVALKGKGNAVKVISSEKN